MIFCAICFCGMKDNYWGNQWHRLDKTMLFHYNTMDYGVWRSLVSRLVRVQEASGSNPDTPTKIPVTTNVVTGILFVSGFERPLRKHAGGMFLGRGRIHYSIEAPLAGVDME